MPKLVHGLHFGNLKGDIYGGLTAAIVALPLALAFGVASGAGPMAGVYGAIIVGFFAAIFGGTPSQISGPTGPMTVVMAVVVSRYAEQPHLAFTVVILAGLFQILFGALRLGKYINLVPFTVISGFMSGIGCIIIVSQLPPLFGHSHPGAGTIANLGALGGDFAKANWHAVAVALGTLAVVYLTPKSIQRLVPSPLIALILGTAVVWIFLPAVPILGTIPSGIPDMIKPALEWAVISDMIGSALVLALLGSIDSLLTSLVADSLTRSQHASNRELIGQGIGNSIAGLFGAIPGAGATMRTVVNIRSGGKTPIAGALHALVLVAIVMGLGPYAAHIPHAVLAGILIKVGIDIVDWRYLKRIRLAPRAGVIIMLTVFGLTVFVDLIIAVGVGIVAASLLMMKRMTDMQLANLRSDYSHTEPSEAEKAILERHGNEIVIYRMSGPMNFGAAKGLMQRFQAMTQGKILLLDLTEVPFIDTSIGMAIEEMLHDAAASGVTVLIVGVQPNVRTTLDRLRATDGVPGDRFVGTRSEALHLAASLISENA
jgi:SulP family sulfate permease